MDRVEEQAALVLLGEQNRLKKLIEESHNRGEEENRMSQAITELILEGEARGKAMGEARGIGRVMKLTQCLLRAGRYDDLEKASRDEDYLKKLCAEFGI